ncbi:hypothetical protein PR202_gb00179 [Eleusine coracana subsp. coracana]|uniref:Uncharacterized protein n=1 Tax=Eleusine coracana subsp. coracana TaxID=191504 RepID=A0AAV5DTE3_ELECO|nr:hypothetical protein PR202_gb00179 [Eleusine coracana subsp. coracana]
MEQCIARLDVAMFNAILRESDDEIPTDPMSDPITDPKVLPIPSGKFSFGAGVQLKNAIGSWSRCLTDLFGMDMDDYPEVENQVGENGFAESGKPFYLLNALSDLLMIPKDVLMDTSTRKELCPTFSSSIIRNILDGFVPDEFCPDPVRNSLLQALESEEHLEGNKGARSIPCSASPILYNPPVSGTILSVIGDPRKSGSAILPNSVHSVNRFSLLRRQASTLLQWNPLKDGADRPGHSPPSLPLSTHFPSCHRCSFGQIHRYRPQTKAGPNLHREIQPRPSLPNESKPGCRRVRGEWEGQWRRWRQQWAEDKLDELRRQLEKS